ncbi:MAG TPA: hypothetical protein EYH40_06310 [Desulfurococcales archaeon]|nr:hypothetical protein [Desulfurococcales archaeon]
MSSSSKPGKELKIISRPALTLNDIIKDKNKILLTYIINVYGEISEKALHYLVKELKDKGFELKYNFIDIAGVPSSKTLHEDVVALLYVGILESNPRNKKLRLTNEGKELLEKASNKLSKDECEKLLKIINEVKPKIIPIDAEQELATMLLRRRGRGRRRSF